jgi:hypothetical protein
MGATSNSPCGSSSTTPPTAELIARNPFTSFGVSKRTRRIDRPDFEIVSTEQYERLCRCARASRTDDYGLIIEGAILAIWEAAIRPGEIFALHHADLDYAENIINIRRQRDPSTGSIAWPKDDDRRWVVMSPTLRKHLRTMPRYSDTIPFPAIRGGYMTQSNWTHYWHAVRASAGMPSQEFYELKHRAIQWMIDPIDDGGVGLDFQKSRRWLVTTTADISSPPSTPSSPSGEPKHAPVAQLTPTRNALPAPKSRPSSAKAAMALQKNPAAAAMDLQ